MATSDVSSSRQPLADHEEILLKNRNWFDYWRQGGSEVPAELPEAITEDTEEAAKAIALVVDGTKRGVVALCKEVASLMKAKSELEKKLESSSDRERLPRIESASSRPRTTLSPYGNQLGVDMPSMSMSSIRDIVNTSRTDLTRRKDEPALGALVKLTRDRIQEALDDIRTLTTHDDNTERQYRETVRINQKLEADLDRARKELTRLRAKLSIAEMTPLQIREERARKKEVEEKAQTIDRETRRERPRNERHVLPRLLSATERAQIVNAKGEYTNSRDRSFAGSGKNNRACSPAKGPDALPPPLHGCQCPVCRSVQSMGGTAFMKGSLKSRRGKTQHGQSVLLGDKVIIKGERSGVVKYIGKLEGVPTPNINDIFLGIHLDQPIGLHNGTFQGRRYFVCPSRHGAFLNVKDVLCVVSRQPPKVSHSKAGGCLARLKDEQERLKVEAERKRRQKMELEAELAETQTRLDRQEYMLSTKRQAVHSLPYYSEAELEADISQFRRHGRPYSSFSEDSDLAQMRLTIESLIDKGQKQGSKSSSGATSDIDKHTVEEAMASVIELADQDRSGVISVEDFVCLLNSQALCMNLSDTEVNLLLEKIHVPSSKMINHRLILPTLLDTLASVKRESGSTMGPNDWCSVYSKTFDCSLFYNLRTGDVRTRLTSKERAQTPPSPETVNQLLDNLLLSAFQERDPKQSGFVSPPDFLHSLKSLNLQLTDVQTELVLAKCGRQQEPTLGVPYINHISQIRLFTSEAIRETATYAKDVWRPVYSTTAGLFYLNKQTGELQWRRPSGQIL